MTTKSLKNALQFNGIPAEKIEQIMKMLSRENKERICVITEGGVVTEVRSTGQYVLDFHTVDLDDLNEKLSDDDADAKYAELEEIFPFNVESNDE